MADKIDQTSIGDRNIIAGSGDLTVNNITHIHSGETPKPEKVDSAGEAKLGTPFGVPNLPPRYLERDDYLDQFRKALLSEETQAVGITGRPQYVGVQGMGGLGKSVLAAALAWDEQVRRTFPDGIFWLRFGQEVDEAGLLELQKEILLVLAPDSQPESPAQGRNLLNLALQGKRCLIIADDLWDSSQLNHFDLADSGCRFLLTTRDAEVIKGTGAHLCELHLLSDEQARELLAKCSGFAEEDLPEEAEAILRECGRLPLAVAAIGSMVNGKGRSRWQLALEKLRHARLDKIPAKFDRYSGYENLFKVFQVSVEDLPQEVQAYYKTLLVFSEDTEIPESVLQLYWEHIGLGDYEPLEAVDLLVQRSLLTPGVNDEAVILHDLLRDYLVFQADGEIAELHRDLLVAYKAAYSGGWHTIPYDEHFYFYKKWPFHVREAGRHDLQAVNIADTLIRNQPLINFRELQELLQFVDYQFSDIASHLLTTSRDERIKVSCLGILGSKAKKEALHLLKEYRRHIDTVFICSRLRSKKEGCRLLSEFRKVFIEGGSNVDGLYVNKETCCCLKDTVCSLKEGNSASVVIACLNLLGNQAKEDAIWLLQQSKRPDIIIACLKLLGDEAEEFAWYFLKESKEISILTACLNMLGNKAKKEMRDLLWRTDRISLAEKMESKNEPFLMACIRILKKETEFFAVQLAYTATDQSIRNECQKMVTRWQNDDASE